MSLSILFGFLPWIMLDLLPKATHAQIILAMAIGLIFTIVSNYKSIKKLYILPCATLAFFTITLPVVTIFNWSWFATHIWVATNSMCALIAWGSLLIKQPFTLQYAKEQYPKEHWTHPGFILVNNQLTTAWGIIFVFNLLINSCKVQLSSIVPGVSSVLTNGSTILGIWLCVWYPKWYANKNKSGEINESLSN